MKISTRAVAVVAGIAAISAAVFAAPQSPNRGPSVLTLKSDGKPVAVLTLKLLDDAPLLITAPKGVQVAGDAGRDGKATFLGGATVCLRQAGEPAAFEIKADEMEVKWSEPQPEVLAAAPQAPRGEPSVLTLKSKGKPVATLTLELLDDAPLMFTSKGSSLFVGSEERGGKASLSGGVTVRSRRAGEPTLFEIKAEEIEMQMDKVKLR